MAALKRPTVLAALLAAVVFIAFFAWYRGAPQLSPDEVDRYMAAVEAQPLASRADLDLAALRRFYEADDGKPFFNVNLFKFRERADYPDGVATPSPKGQSGRDAFDRYSAFMQRTLPRYASHVAFAGSGASVGDWDVVAVVRYRSRRDYAELHADPTFAAHAIHKWAALARYEHYPVSSPAYLSTPYPFLLILLAFLVFVTHRIERRVRAGGAPAPRAEPAPGGRASAQAQ